MSLDYTVGCVNFRDVGEFINLILGQEILAKGKLFRGGKIDFVNSHAEIALAASIINLRKEIDPLKFDATYFHFPISNDHEKYQTSNKFVRRWLNKIIKVLVEERLIEPVLIHCTSGKDRTGVVVAAVLKILNIPDEAIIEEYLLSEGKVKRAWIEQALLEIGEPQKYFNLPSLQPLSQKFIY